MNCRKLLWSLLLVFNVFSAFADDSECSNGTILFREDFGGNSVSDPALGPALPDGLVSLPFCDHEWAKLKNGYDIRKEAIRRRDFNPHNHIYAGWYADFGDHTYEDDLTRGYFMVVDLDYEEATFYKTRVDNLCENTNLTFSFWGRSLNASSSAPVTITIEDLSEKVLAQKQFTLSSSVYAWSRFELPFSVPEGETSIVYKVFSGAGGNGGDLALDDIEVRLCKAPVEVNEPDDSLCVGSDFKMNAFFANTDNTYVEPLTYTWFKNTQKNYNEQGWTKIETGSSLSFPHLSSIDEGYYKVFVSSAGVEGSFNMCNSSSDIIEIKLKTCDCMPTDTLIKDTICAGGSYSFGGKLLTEAGVYECKLLNTAGCDSLVTLMLSVLPQSSQHIVASVSVGEEFNEKGFNLPKQTEVGTFTHQIKLTNQYGCDSIVDLTLTVNPCSVPTEDVVASICRGKSYSWGTRDLTEAGVYMLNGKTQNGCDSLVKLTLSVLPLSLEYVTASVSLGEDYKENGFDLPKQTEIGTFTHQITLTNQYGCDSTVNLVLEVTSCSLPTENVSVSICQGESYSWNQKELTETGIYNFNGKTQYGCDSVVSLSLVVLPTSEGHITDKAFLGEEYSENGFELPAQTELGIFAHQIKLTNQYGCDSIVNLALTVAEPPVEPDDIAIPDVFTPHHREGKNDFFMLGYEVYIYDRYGNLVCHSTEGWDGYYRGKVADPGVYIYTVFLKDGRKVKGSIEVYK